MGLQLRLESVPSLFSEGCEAGHPDGGADRVLSLRAEQARQTQRRAALLHESAAQRGLRLGRNLLQALNPRCLASLGPTVDLLWREHAIGSSALPDPELALAAPDGLAGLAPDLSAPVLQAAYARGLHPRGLMGPATFWAPARRLAQHPANLKLDNGLRGLLHKGELEVAFDRDFDALLIACAARSASSPRMSGRMLRAYAGLFDAGAAHGFEVRDRHGRLAGGGFGVAAGGAFVLERWTSPQPVVTISTCPSGWVCQAVRAPGSKVTALPAALSGSRAGNSGSIRTVPENHSEGPVPDGCAPILLISMMPMSPERKKPTRKEATPPALESGKTAASLTAPVPPSPSPLPVTTVCP